MKVRATQDGTYGGYYRHGPIQTENGNIEGEIFEIEDGEWPAIDPETKKPIMDVQTKEGQIVMERVSKQAVDGKGNPVIDEKGRPVMISVEQPKVKARMWNWFDAGWMEKVSDDEEATYDLPKFEIPPQYRVKKAKKAAPVPVREGQNLLPVI
jgi:hypothetical protein